CCSPRNHVSSRFVPMRVSPRSSNGSASIGRPPLMCDDAQLRLLGLGDGALPKTRPVYRHIAHAIERGITTGALALDFRLPAERELAEALKVSRTTVVSAYRDLETRGLVRGYVGRGTFVSAAPE